MIFMIIFKRAHWIWLVCPYIHTESTHDAISAFLPFQHFWCSFWKMHTIELDPFFHHIAHYYYSWSLPQDLPHIRHASTTEKLCKKLKWKETKKIHRNYNQPCVFHDLPTQHTIVWLPLLLLRSWQVLYSRPWWLPELHQARLVGAKLELRQNQGAPPDRQFSVMRSVHWSEDTDHCMFISEWVWPRP